MEIEKIKVEFQQKGGPISDCSQVSYTEERL